MRTQSLSSSLAAATLLVILSILVYLGVPYKPAPGYGAVTEDAERAIFLAFVLAVIPMGLVTSTLVRKLQPKMHWAVPAALFCASLINIFPLLAEMPTAVAPAPTWIFIAAQVVTAAWFWLSRPGRNTRDRWLQIGIGGLLCFAAVSFRVYSVHSVADTWAMTAHLDAVLYSVSQVANGKSVLVDLPAQYGLYAEFLGPIFGLTGGASVLKFTLIMALLQTMAVLMVLSVVFGLVRTRLMRLLCAGSLASVIGYVFMAPSDAYFQYYPIRFFFPAVVTFLHWYHLTRPARWRTSLLGALAALAIFFNIDSGIPAFGSCLASFVIATILSRTQRRVHLRHLGVFLVSALVATTVFIALLYLKGTVPDWTELLRYQRLFYLGATYMLPMAHKPDLWMLVVGVYILGIVSCMHFASAGRLTVVWRAIFQLSVLGVGLFAYFQGRSHIIVLLLASWPAFLILFTLADRTTRAVRARLLSPEWRVAAFASVFLGSFLTCVFAVKVPPMWVAMNAAVEEANGAQENHVTRNISFIRSQTKDGGAIVIVAPHDAVYYMELGIAAAASGPGVTENLLPVDRIAFVQKSLKRATHLFVEPNTTYIPAEYLALLESDLFRVVATSSDGMLHLRRR